MSTDEELPRFEPLDGRDGPALPLSPHDARLVADAITTRLEKKRRGRRVVAMAAGFLLLACGAAAAVLRYTASQEISHGPQLRDVHKVTKQRETPALTRTNPENPPTKPLSNKNDTQTDLPAPASSRDWLKLANAARARREFARAERLYLRAASLHPRSDVEAAAHLAVAELRYQHLGRPREALPLYRKLLKTRARGPLAEQAQAGIARVYATLGDDDGEKNAWETLLRQYPNSWFANEARSRLAEIIHH